MAIAIDHVIQEAPATDSATHNQEEPVPEQATVKRERRESTGGDDHEQSFFAFQAPAAHIAGPVAVTISNTYNYTYASPEPPKKKLCPL